MTVTASQRLTEIKARTEAATERRRDSFKPVFISQTERDRERLLAALEAVLDIDPGEPTCAEDVGYYDGIMAARRVINEALCETSLPSSC